MALGRDGRSKTMFVPVPGVEPPLDQPRVWREQPRTEELPDAARNWHGAGETPGEASQALQAE